MSEFDESHEAMSKLASGIAQAFIKNNLEQLESFEQYAHILRSHFLKNEVEFKEHFLKGYEILRKELSEGKKV